jgi:putative ABC transport system substrate-binding protein
MTLIALVGYLSACWQVSIAGAEQPPAPRRIGVLLAIFSPESREAHAFRQGMRDAGYIEGRDVVIQWRSANGDYSRASQLVAELIQSKVEVIVVESTIAAQAIKRATSTIPVVMAVVADPVGSGLAASLAHPGGNFTGLSVMTTDLTARRLQLLKEAIPRLTKVAVLYNPDASYSPSVIEELKAAAPALSLELSFEAARTAKQFGPVFSAFTRAHAQAVYMIADAFLSVHRAALLELASKAQLPVMSSNYDFAKAGGLMFYGPNFAELYRRSAGYVDRILKGAKPADLPIEQPSKFDLIVNLKTAKALRLTIPESILLRADEVIR